MSTFRRSIAAVAIGATATLLLAQTGAGRPCCADDTQSESRERQAPAPAAPQADFSLEGMFVDCCSCPPPCPCELIDVASACRGVGAHQIRVGTYAGEDLSGVTIAHAKVVGQWVNLYIDAKDEQQRAVAEKFGRAVFAKFGPIREVKAARIEISGADGRYVVTVDGGKLMRIETEPVLGGDGKTPIGYTNIKNAVNPTVFQATVVSATYTDGDKKVTVEKGRNSHFNPKLKSSGKI